MGGRGDTSKSFNENKIVSNIDAPRNKPFRDKRAKELADEAAQVAKMQTATKSTKQTKTLSKEKLIGKDSDVRILVGFDKGKFTPYPGQKGDNPMGTWEEIPKYETVRSVAGIGRMQLTPGEKFGKYNLTDAKSGYAVRTGLSKKQGIEYLKASVKKDGTLSKTIERHFDAQTQGKYHKTSTAAFDKLANRIEYNGKTPAVWLADWKASRKK